MGLGGSVSISALKSEYGVSYNRLSQYYGIPSNPDDIPRSGAISLGNFRYHSKATPTPVPTTAAPTTAAPPARIFDVSIYQGENFERGGYRVYDPAGSYGGSYVGTSANPIEANSLRCNGGYPGRIYSYGASGQGDGVFWFGDARVISPIFPAGTYITEYSTFSGKGGMQREVRAIIA